MRERDKDEIRHQLDLLFRAYIERDPQKLRATYAPDWVGFSPTSPSIIKGLEAGIIEAETAWTHWSLLDYEMIEINYIFYGNVCAVPYVARVRNLSDDDQLSEFEFRSVAIYVQQQGEWRQVAANTSLYPPGQPRSL